MIFNQENREKYFRYWEVKRFWKHFAVTQGFKSFIDICLSVYPYISIYLYLYLYLSTDFYTSYTNNRALILVKVVDLHLSLQPYRKTKCIYICKWETKSIYSRKHYPRSPFMLSHSVFLLISFDQRKLCWRGQPGAGDGGVPLAEVSSWPGSLHPPGCMEQST